MDKVLRPGKVSLEILVHISAPVTNANDDMQRKQARALTEYLDDIAQPANSINRTEGSSTLILQSPLADESHKEHKVNHDLGHLHKNNIAISESLLTSASSKDATSSGSVKLPPPRHMDTPLIYNQRLKSPTSSTASVLGDPRVFRTTSTAQSKSIHVTPQNVVGRGGQSFDTDGVLNATFSTASIGPSPDSTGFILHSPNYIQTKKRKFSEITEEPCKAPEVTVLSECSPNMGRKRQRLTTIAEKGNSTSIYEKNASQTEPDKWVGSIAQFSSSIVGNSAETSLPTTNLPEPCAPCRTYLPPGPDTGIEQYKTHKIGVFAYIASNTMLCNAYKPKSTKRPVEPLERGYWRLKIPFSWSTEAQDDFWSLLADMIVEGKCGWGNWIEHVDPGSTKNAYIADIKVWCWGEVVREMWLAVLMASRRQTMRLGMAWYDSCGNIVIQMR